MRALDEVPYRDLLRLSNRLEQAVWDHAGWLLDWHRMIVNRVPMESGALEDDAYLHCRFGEWFHGQGVDLLNGDEDVAAIAEIHRAVHEKARQLAEVALLGEEIPIREYGSFLEQLGTLREKLEDLQRELRRFLFDTDPLTRVLNRRSVDRLVGEQIDECRILNQRCLIALVDVDDFRRINDRYGHAVGDEVLKGIGLYLVQHLRSSDMTFRFGGEEFLLCLPDVAEQEGFDALNRIRRALSARNLRVESGADVTVSISLGLAFSRKDEDLPRTIERATQSLDAAKRAGRNHLVLAK